MTSIAADGTSAGALAPPTPELTITADGAFWSPFAPTVRRGVLDTDLLLSRTPRPLQRPVDAMLTVLGGRPEGADSTLNIR
ncbi:hypothetical protein OF117_15840 [Geodermatophilus sp. YIM 151500]|uniref:hypothetical protein n=1 Tax=Geodermatophilus sp. YIM 151500 TaxID=2984531 RepID=UPI0021E3728E|nr:hypothetical protein [Geodermatophilus sp. YIM 151500]MCV2490828.1 hypothetical protein [Geodermatophilus sp. YIM 151500]